MAEYDSNPPVFFDSGVTYDSGPLPQRKGRMAKAKVKLSLDSKSDSELATFADAHVTAVTGNPNFTTPLPTGTVFAGALSLYKTALGDFNTAQAAAKQATTVKDTARDALESALSQRGNYVELTAAEAADPEAVVKSAGFEVKAPASAPQMPEPVSNLSATAGDNAGELDLQWDPSLDASSYEVQTSPDPITPTSWVSQPSVTKSKTVILGLPSGSKVWARVRAVGPGGTGAWSDLTSKIVP